jgi:protoporphyrinogen oxidase
LVLYNLELAEPPLQRYQWCYFGSRDISFSRVTTPALFSHANCPAGAGSLCVELGCQEGDAVWREPEKRMPEVGADLVKTGYIRSAEAIRAVHVERVANAYPRYSLDYERRLLAVQSSLSAFANLRLAGRTGLFWYNNMDDSIENGMAVARGLAAGPREPRP